MPDGRKGERNKNSKLTVERVREIKKLLAQGYFTQKEIAEQFQISQAAVSSINAGRTWSHVRVRTRIKKKDG